MPRKKSAAIARAQALKATMEQISKSRQTDEANETQTTGTQPSCNSELILHETMHAEQETHQLNGSSPCLDNPDCLASHLDRLDLTSQDRDDPDKEIVFEDPPEAVECADDEIRCFQSLAEPESAVERRILDDGDAEPNVEEDEDKDPNAKRMNTQPIPKDEANRMIKELEGFVTESYYGHGKFRRTHLSEVFLTRLRLMLATLRLLHATSLGLIEASEYAAIMFSRGRWAARKAREWIRQFQEENELPANVYGSWNESVIEDEDLASAIQDYLTKQGKYIKAANIIDFFHTRKGEKFLPLLDSLPSLRTCQRWMIRMGYTWMKEKRGQFADGHEREDVVEYRMKYYIPQWIKLERRMRSWTKDGLEIPPKLQQGERVAVVWFHDESTFYAHDRRLTRWVHEGETAALYKKGEGVSLMVADFVSADYGWLRMDPGVVESVESQPGDQIFEDARVVFRAGKSRDGWFGTADVVQQLSRAMAIVKKLYPNKDHVFVFDNATIHTKLPADAPNVANMTLRPSKNVKGEEILPTGEKVKVNMAPAVLPDGSPQQLYYPVDHPNEQLRGAFKGLTKLLEERGIPGARKLRLHCPSTDSQKGPGCLPTVTDCCARRTMMNQPDFLNQKSILQLSAEAEGCSVMYLPKYHCELNPIEQCWGAAKRVYRESPTSSTEADLRCNMLSSLDSVEVNVIRKYAARSRRFVHAYSDGLTGEQAAWAQKSYRGHRVLSEGVMRTFDEPGHQAMSPSAALES